MSFSRELFQTESNNTSMVCDTNETSASSQDSWNHTLATTPVNNASLEFDFQCMNTSSLTDYHWEKYIFIIGTVTFGIGFVGNIITLLVIIKLPRLHTPTYTAVACLSFSDLFALMTRYIMILPEPVSSYFDDPSRQSVVYVFIFLFLHSANFHMVLISYIRYLFITRPFKSLKVDCRKIIQLSQIIWIFSFTMTGIYSVQAILSINNILSESMKNWSELVFSVYIGGLPLFVILYFHVRQIYCMHRLPLTEREHRLRLVRSMSAILLVILILYFLSISYPFIYTILDALYHTNTGGLSSIAFQQLFDFFLLFNNSANPLIYFFFSLKSSRLFSKRRRKFANCSIRSQFSSNKIMDENKKKTLFDV
ncbi:melanocyte-stimulating hormone receptor-like [Saccostrea cucullata]|uniref:melanocyte-stimulating hormone receptor-like n=1 Tax=Saccostrea cuccullata TaxID=36930 RepID=UPI002ED16BC8